MLKLVSKIMAMPSPVPPREVCRPAVAAMRKRSAPHCKSSNNGHRGRFQPLPFGIDSVNFMKGTTRARADKRRSLRKYNAADPATIAAPTNQIGSEKAKLLTPLASGKFQI